MAAGGKIAGLEIYRVLDALTVILLRRILKRPLRKLEFKMKSRAAQVLRNTFLRIKAPIFVTFDSSKSVDGTGAQLQRQATVMALARYFGFTFINSDFRQVSVHALDPFQSEPEYAEYLVRLNSFLNTGSISSNLTKSSVVEASKLTFSFLISECILQLIRREERNYLVFEPYPVSEFCPKIMDELNLQSNEIPKACASQEVYKLVIHYRQGVGGFAIYPGQNIPREISMSAFVSRVEVIAKELPDQKVLQIVVVTDAPEVETVFTPPASQLKLWEGTPGFSNGRMTIRPAQFEDLKKLSKLPLKIVRGGNPLDTIIEMATADGLLIGKSSLSYVAGLLNHKGQVYYPKDFWHRPLQDWRQL